MTDDQKREKALHLLKDAQKVFKVKKNEIGELKALNSPPADVHNCMGYFVNILDNKAGCAEW